MPIPKVIHQPTTHYAIQQGVQKMVDAIRPTLGPLPRQLVYQNFQKYELLDDGGVIARRIIQLDDRQEDVGAMLLRQVLWQVNQQVGDGCATTAVLYEAVYTEGLRYLAAGVNAMRLRQHLMQALRQLSTALMEQRQDLNDITNLKQIAKSICYDEEMAAVIGEVIDTVGQYGQVDIRKGHGRGVDHTYVEGSYWAGGVQSKEMTRKTIRGIAEMQDAAILITDMDIKEPRELVPLMQQAMQLKIENLLIIVHSISDKGMSVVLDERLREKVNTVVVKLSGFVQDDHNQAYEDISRLTGAIPILNAAGQTLEHVGEANFGSARWVWADDKNFGFAGGKGDPIQLREHVKALRGAYNRSIDNDNRERLLNRLGRLYGGSATVYVGGITQKEIDAHKALAERTVRAVRNALAGGVITGGGTALLKCQAMLEAKAKQQTDLEVQAAYRILAKAVEAPIRALLDNSGYDASEIMAQLQHESSAHGFDMLHGEIVDMDEAGILDVAHVQKEALERAVSSAALALTVDVMVLHRNPTVETEP